MSKSEQITIGEANLILKSLGIGGDRYRDGLFVLEADHENEDFYTDDYGTRYSDGTPIIIDSGNLFLVADLTSAEVFRAQIEGYVDSAPA